MVQAAARLFEERGFLATTVRDIAREADVSVGTVMAAGDKEALLVELFDGLIEERQQLADTQVLGGNVWCGTDAVAVVEPFVVLFEERRDLAHAYASILVSGWGVSRISDSRCVLRWSGDHWEGGGGGGARTGGSVRPWPGRRKTAGSGVPS
ncbi:hypothetical protein CJ197_14695 [Brachybacterium sp. UMB0905]|nr:hypothetical protein CJ197_14695 [Brachybacterium sp. UMB0905]